MLLHLLILSQTLGGGVQIPESHAARAWAGVGPETEPVVLADVLFDEAPWLVKLGEAPATERWEQWGAWISAEQASEDVALDARAGLVCLAAAEDRWEDAWWHFSRLGGSPEWAAAVMPHLLPGIPLEHGAALGGLPAPLPDGVLLHPAVPPALPDDPRGSLRHRIATIEGIRIADATITMTITIEPSGVQVDLLHVSGGPVTVSVLLPESFGRLIKIEYIDWMREEVAHQPLTVELLPGSEELNLFGRYTRAPERLPQVPKGELARGLVGGGIWFDCGEDAELAEEVAPFAASLADVFELPAGMTVNGMPPARDPWTPTVCQLPAGTAGKRRLSALASAAERYALESH